MTNDPGLRHFPTPLERDHSTLGVFAAVVEHRIKEVVGIELRREDFRAGRVVAVLRPVHHFFGHEDFTPSSVWMIKCLPDGVCTVRHVGFNDNGLLCTNVRSSKPER